MVKIYMLLKVIKKCWSTSRTSVPKLLQVLVMGFLPCVPGIVAFIPKNIEPLIFFSSYSLCPNHFSWEFTKKIKAWAHLPACIHVSRHAFVIPGARFYFIRVTIPGTLCSCFLFLDIFFYKIDTITNGSTVFPK